MQRHCLHYVKLYVYEDMVAMPEARAVYRCAEQGAALMVMSLGVPKFEFAEDIYINTEEALQSEDLCQYCRHELEIHQYNIDLLAESYG